MKKFEDFTVEDLCDLRQQIVLNSLYVSDYENNFGIKANSVSSFFDSYLDYLCELAEEDGVDSYDNNYMDIIFDNYDTLDNLHSWYCCYDNFDWVEYNDDEE